MSQPKGVSQRDWHHADADEAAEDAAVPATAAAAANVQAALVKRVLPALSEQLIVKNEVACRTSVGSLDASLYSAQQDCLNDWTVPGVAGPSLMPG